MSGFELLLVVAIVFGGLYALGLLPRARLVTIYKRIRLIGLLWALAIVLLAIARIFDFP